MCYIQIVNRLIVAHSSTLKDLEFICIKVAKTIIWLSEQEMEKGKFFQLKDGFSCDTLLFPQPALLNLQDIKEVFLIGP